MGSGDWSLNCKTVTVVVLKLEDLCLVSVYSRASQYPKNPLKVPTFPEFEQLYWAEFKARQNKIRNERKQLVSINNIDRQWSAVIC